MPTPPTFPSVAVLGLGAMGRRMARRLLDAGVPLVVWNRSPDAAADLVASGARLASTPREAARGAGVVLAMVTDDDASRAVWTGAEGALHGVDPGAVAVEASTLTPGYVAEWARAVRTAGATPLDAPVVGSRPQAEAGALAFLVGGDGDALAHVRPLLDVMGGAVHACGPVGSGAAMKLIVNASFAAQVAQAAEALALARALGLDGAADVLRQLPVTSPAAAGALGAIEAGAFDPLFPIDLVAKDLRYTEATAERAGVEAPIASAARAVYERAQDEGHGGLNVTGVARLYDPA